MYFGVDYHPEHWVYPYDGTKEDPEGRWKRDAELMAECGVNVVRMGEFCWGLYEPEEGKFDFDWMARCIGIMEEAGIKVVLATPTAAPPVWLAKKHPEILPLDSRGLPLSGGTRHSYCKNSDLYWDYSQKIIRALAKAFGKSPQLIAWQIDNGVGGHNTECSYNPVTASDWHGWLEAKYKTVEELNHRLGLRFWGQVVGKFEDVPLPMQAPAPHNPALVLDWHRFSSDTCVAYVRMQADLLRELTPDIPVTTNLRAMSRLIDYFDLAETLDFVSMDSSATTRHRAAENAMDIDMIRSLKRGEIKTPDDADGFWVMEQKAGQVSWQDVNSLVRPGVVRMFTFQSIARGANGVLYFFWRQPRIGSEKFYGGVLTHDGRGDNRVFEEIKQVGQEVQRVAEVLKGTCVKAEVGLVYTHDNDWALRYPVQPTKLFNLRQHLQLFYTALHDRNIPVDFVRPIDDLTGYKLLIAPSLHLMSAAESDRLRLFVHNGGTLLATCNTGLVDENDIASNKGFPHHLTDLFGLEVREFEVLEPDAENHLILKGNFPTSHAHTARVWCDLIEPIDCQVVGTYAKDFFAGRPALTLKTYGLGKAVYLGTISQQAFYFDLVTWLRGLAGVSLLLKVPEKVEVSLRQDGDRKVYFLINQHNSPVRIGFFKPVHDFLTGQTISSHYDLPAHGVLVLDEGAETR